MNSPHGSPVFRFLPALFKVKWFCSLWVCIIGFNVNGRANHIGGAEVTYSCTSTPGIFEVTLVLYRNCDGTPLCPGTCGAPCTQTMNVYGVDSGFHEQNMGNFNLSLVNVRDVNPNASCPGSKNICTNMGCVTPGTYSPGMERYEFKGLVNIGSTSSIPAACCNVRFVWETCCRSNAIQTFSSPGTTNFYVEAVVNRCLSISPCNSSPRFINEPLVIICGGENYVFNNGAIDPDADSLSFAFAPALQGFNSPVAYTGPWSAATPIPYSGASNSEFPGGIRCDAVSGDISCTPGNASGQNFTGVVAVTAKQWKKVNGVLTVIGSVRRDIQMLVLGNCLPNNPPRFTTNPPHPLYPNAPQVAWEICAGEQLCFTITAKDTDFVPPRVSDTTTLSWDSVLSGLGATFNQLTPENAREKPYQFCWTPNDSLIRTNPYYFTVSAKDSRCPNPGRITRSFAVRVKSKLNLSLYRDSSGCGFFQPGYVNNSPSVTPGAVIWQISRYPGDFGMKNNPYQFANVSKCPKLIFTEAGKYGVILMATNNSLSSTNCTQFYYDTLVVTDAMISVYRVNFLINNDTQCFNVHSFVFTDTSSAIYLSRKWDFGDGSQDTGNMVVKRYMANQKYTVKYTVVDKNNCTASISKQVAMLTNKLSQPLCRVTVDSATRKNMIVWIPVNPKATANFRIYKEIGTGAYALLGSTPGNAQGVFLDSASAPDVKLERYAISAIDTCGNESAKSSVLQTIYLTAFSEPGNAWSLNWGLVPGGVEIYRGSSPAGMVMIKSVQGGITTYTDLGAPQGPNYYRVSTKPGNPCDSSGRYVSSQSNIVLAMKTGLPERPLSEKITFSPNPVTNELSIHSRSDRAFYLKLYDAMGRTIFATEMNGVNTKLNLEHLPDGFYTMECRMGDEVFYQKMIKR